jgi:hypothetical protein
MSLILEQSCSQYSFLMANIDSHLNRLTPDYGLALLQTVSQNGAEDLRAAILGHVARRTALQVKTRVRFCASLT